MKLKKLRKKIQRLEKRLREGPQKLAKLKGKLQEAETARALKAARRSAARATAARPASKPSSSTGAKKAKRRLNLSPERRAQLSAAMKARWAAKRATEASGKPGSSDDQHGAPGQSPQPPESRPDGA